MRASSSEKGNSNSVLNRPPALESFIDSASCFIVLRAPISKAKRFIVKSEIMITILVTSLFGIGCPLAVVGIVAFTVLFAFNRMVVCWAHPHIGQKVYKAICPAPPFVNREPTPAVFRKVDMFRVVASLNHLVPRGVGGSLTKSVSPITSALRYNLFYRHVRSFSANVFERASGLPNTAPSLVLL